MSLVKVRGSVLHEKVSGDEVEVCEIQIMYDNPGNLKLSVELSLEDDKFISLQQQDPKNFMTRLKMVCIINYTLSKIMFCLDPL